MWSHRGSGSLHRAVDEQTGAIRAFDLPIRTEIEKDPGMAMRLVAAIARGDRLVYVDRFGRPHMPPRNGAGADHTRLTVLTSIDDTLCRSTINDPSRPQLRACGIDKNAVSGRRPNSFRASAGAGSPPR